MKIQKRPFGLWLLMLCLLLAPGGIYGGIAFLVDPTGRLLQIPSTMLEKLPVPDFRLPGLFLLTIMGTLPLILLYTLYVPPRWSWTDPYNRWSQAHWSWTATFLLSLVLILWIMVEVILIGMQAPIQWITGPLGIVMLILVLLPSVRKYYTEKRT